MTELEQKIITIIETTLPQKIEENPYFIRYTFYEVIVKHNLPQKAEIVFDSLFRNKLYHLGYIVYFSGTEYEYDGQNRIVENNELAIAIKKVEERKQSNGRKTKKTKHI